MRHLRSKEAMQHTTEGGQKTGTFIGGKYEVLGRLGSGGAGCVYRVRDCRLDKIWAAKQVRRDCIGMEERVLGKVKNAAFPRIVDLVEEGEYRFLIMDWIEGETLEKRLERTGPFAAEEVVQTGILLCEALESLHQMQPPLLYLDLKPSNIMLDTAGHMRLVDFGSAVEAGDAAAAPVAATPGYAAPEQLARCREKRRVDVRADVFGLGRTLYVLLGGTDPAKPPYGASPLRDCAPDVPGALAAIVERCMEPDPAQRFQTMDAVKSALEAFAATKRKRRRTAWLWPLGKGGMLALALWRGAAFYQTAQLPGTPPKTRLLFLLGMLVPACLAILLQQVESRRAEKRPYFETLQSVLRTEKKPGRWMFPGILLCCLLSAAGNLVAAEAAATQHVSVSAALAESGRDAGLQAAPAEGGRGAGLQAASTESGQDTALPVVLRDAQFRKLLVKKGAVVSVGKPLYLELDPQLLPAESSVEIRVTGREADSGRVREYVLHCVTVDGNGI